VRDFPRVNCKTAEETGKRPIIKDLTMVIQLKSNRSMNCSLLYCLLKRRPKRETTALGVFTLLILSEKEDFVVPYVRSV
jgi:hypothetical protein